MKRSLTRNLIVLVVSTLLMFVLIAGGRTLRTENVQVQPSAKAAESSKEGYILRTDEGELLQRGKGNSVNIKVGPRTGSPGMSMGTQVLDAGVGIPVHMHEHEDEVLFVHEGAGVAIMAGQRKNIGKGDTIYIPHGVWHGVETRDIGVNLLWVVTPPGLEEFFRAISSPVNAPPKILTPAQIEDIGRKHGVRFKAREPRINR